MKKLITGNYNLVTFSYCNNEEEPKYVANLSPYSFNFCLPERLIKRVKEHTKSKSMIKDQRSKSTREKVLIQKSLLQPVSLMKHNKNNFITHDNSSKKRKSSSRSKNKSINLKGECKFKQFNNELKRIYIDSELSDE